MNEKLNAAESANIKLASAAGLGESCQAEGVYTFKCFEYAQVILLLVLIWV